MLRWIFVGASCLACLAYAATGDWPRQVPASQAAAPDPYVAQALPPALAAAVRDANAAQLLDRAQAALREVRWLKSTIWQRLHNADDGYDAETHLVLGPDHCARLDITVHTASAACRRLVISDGHALAEVVCRADQPDKVAGCLLPDRTDAAARDQFLQKKGCVGPQLLLAQLRKHAAAWHVETGMLRQCPVVRLQGPVDPKGSNLAAPYCRLYLDAATLWPVRLEWRTSLGPPRAHLRLEMEFRDPELNRPLSPEECARAFTFESKK